MNIPVDATHFKDGQFYRLTWSGPGYYKLCLSYWVECEPVEDAWPIEGLTLLALEVEEWPVNSLHFEYTWDQWYYRRLELGLEEIRTLGGGNPEDFEITYYKLSGGAQEKVMSALLKSMAVMTRVLDGEQCYNAASSAYWSIEEALETMEEITE